MSPVDVNHYENGASPLKATGANIMNVSGGWNHRKGSGVKTITKQLELSGPAHQPLGQLGSGGQEENLELVPCRWSNTGWKYVQKPTA